MGTRRKVGVAIKIQSPEPKSAYCIFHTYEIQKEAKFTYVTRI